MGHFCYTGNRPAKERITKQLLDSQPDPVVWFYPVLEAGTGTERIKDFKAPYGNGAAPRILGVAPPEVSGQRLLSSQLMDEISRKNIFEQCLLVWQTGEPVESTFYSPGLVRFTCRSA